MCREQWQRECVKLLESPRLWDECQQTSPETAEALHVTLDIMSGWAWLMHCHHLLKPVYFVMLGGLLSVWAAAFLML